MLPIVLFLVLVARVASQDILGCGGFVKSEVEINFSFIEVKLYTKQGSLKYQTDCAPNNGYYMIPVYDKGDYVLKVEPPPGWKFEPESVDLLIDGQNDKCSKGEDINFQFTGFGVVGKVVSQGESIGPAEVTLLLKKPGSDQILQQTTSVTGGDYSFEKVLPGEYIVEGTHSKWVLKPTSTPVSVVRETGRAGNSITIMGYDVSGKVMGEGEPIKDVRFLLFSAKKTSQVFMNCEKTPVPGYTTDADKQPICHVSSQADGSFLFPTVPTGSYKLMPFYKGEWIKFDVMPTEMKFTVNHESLALKKPFQVTGFSVSGKVLASTKGSGISGASIMLNGGELTKTRQDGSYSLDSMKAGTYSIDVHADRVYFDTTQVKITPTTPLLPDIVAARFEVCGQIVIDKLPEGIAPNLQRTVKVSSATGTTKQASLLADSAGTFCTDLTPGTYIFKPLLREGEAKAGLKLFPSDKEVIVTNKPMNGVTFSQFRARISGTVACLENCGLIQLSLSAVGKSEEKKSVQTTEIPKGITFTFDDVMPGKYKVTLHHDAWCWTEKVVQVEVVDKDLSDVQFSQSGYILSCSLSHDVPLNFAHDSKSGNVGSFNLTKGLNKFCLSQPGIYKLNPVSCHQFEKDVFTYDTSRPSVLTLTAVKHLTEGIITTQKPQDDIYISIKSSVDTEKPVKLGPLTTELAVPSEETKDSKQKPAPSKEPITYKFTYMAKSGEKLTFTPSSKVLLFHPEVREVTIQGDVCPGVVAQFEGRQGLFLSGTIHPVLEGVKIAISSDNPAYTTTLTQTNTAGTYKVGPLHADAQYTVTAEKEGYVLSQVDGKPGDFKASKLAEVIVQVEDDASLALPGVLLSLSGGVNYRSNNLTRADGSMNFISLSPGQYFLRPMMKEFSFEPASQMINVEEGSTNNVKIHGNRVAFSCYGSVTSLNGEPEPGVFVEAVGSGDGDCGFLQEESKTEQDGAYRIRGLQPNCNYDIKLKKGDTNQHIERASPKIKTVKVVDSDLTQVNIIAFRRMNQLDLSGNVITPHEFLSTLKVHLYRGDNIDSAIHTVSLGQSSFFYLPSLTIDHQEYVLRLDSTLARASNDYTLPEVVFTANCTFKHFTLKFNPQKKQVDQELNPSSFMVLPLTALILYLSYNYQKVLPLVSQASSTLLASMMKPSQSKSAYTPPVNMEISPELLSEFATKKKKPRRA